MKKEKWKPEASIDTLKKRAKILSLIRLFFKKNKILEIDTPMLSLSTITDVNLCTFKTYYYSVINTEKKTLWLTTSPEYHMKRLLSAGIGPIYQICHSFRNKEFGKYHNPEFTILEWYRPFYSMHELIKEVDHFLQYILNCKKCSTISYQDVFIKYLNIDPLSTNILELRQKSKELQLDYLTNDESNIEKLIELLFFLKIEPNLGKKKPVIIYHFPIAQASLAAINVNDSRVSDRFEIFFQGIELGNGFHELTDCSEQKNRFIRDNKNRLDMNLPVHKLDQLFLDSLSHGLPPCSGIAIGIDRLIMLALKKNNIREVMAFSLKNC